MNIGDKASNFINEPQRINTAKFCQAYQSLSESYWNLSDTDVLSSIDSAYEQVLLDKNTGKNIGRYNGMSDGQIKREFDKKRIALFKTIPAPIAKIIQDKIDDCLRRNTGYASSCNMRVPDRNQHLSVEEYYLNYELAKEVLLSLKLILGNRLK
jgi:hypothetical protein